MATPIKNNLPPASQQWVRDIERRMTDLERQNQLLQITANKNATQIGAIMQALRNIPLSAFQRAERSGSGSLNVSAKLTVPAIIPTVSCLVVASVNPWPTGPSGSPVVGTGTFSVSDQNYLYVSAGVVPEVTSYPGPGDGDTSSSLASFLLDEAYNDDDEPEDWSLEASLSASFSGGSGAGGGSTSLMLLAFPSNVENN